MGTAGLTALAGSFAFAPASKSQAAVLFEGYSKILIAGQRVGAVVERYDFDERSKEFSLAYVLKIKTPTGTATQSLKARSNAAMQPLSYSYTSLDGNVAESIDATFKGQDMTLKIRKGSDLKTVRKRVKKGVFLSRFMVYLMLQSKEGIKTGSKYSFEAIAEEDGQTYPGEAIVQSREEFAGESAFKVVSKFKGEQFVGFVNGKGEVLASRAPALGLSTEVVADPQEATEGVGLSASTLRLVFGDVPAGKENAIARKAAAQPPPASAGSNSAVQMDESKRRRFERSRPPQPGDEDVKGGGVPHGRGIVVKPEGEDEPPSR